MDGDCSSVTKCSEGGFPTLAACIEDAVQHRYVVHEGANAFQQKQAVADNILPRISGLSVALAVQAMPRDDSPYGAVASVEQKVPRFGLVRFTARRMRSKRDRLSYLFWSVESAEKLAP